ncbi:MAG TPA: hypothetical protein VN814_18990 [Caulobacteraceae bacterium]|nr:hypothetical protein [Caulobacteraceae bacterium]
MGLWIATAAAVIVALGIPLAALAGKGAGRRLRGNLQLAAIFLGLGEVPIRLPSIDRGRRARREGEPGARRADEAGRLGPAPSNLC